ncbi:hypothetical protein D9619_007057 [Psilocybe cf. subviscida]|uniref:VPS37 C-terminal domain-containing protein n=1 Tax=Psilocybe cf. subviscida TaxID=2480587 RepID=A0A8H5B242_9AGAR|nr:hypothetical protein D9619_007057 [Psilocybe cf. subviscida]
MATQLQNDFPELSHLSREDLEDMLSDPTYFQAVFHSLGYVQDLYRSQTELGQANEAIAKNALALQQHLYDLRTETKDAFEEAKRLEARWKELEKEQKEVYQRYTPQFLLMRLRHSTTAQDDASEAIATSFVQDLPEGTSAGDPGAANLRTARETDEFIKTFREARKIYHKRAIWSTKWANGGVIWRED